MAVKKTEAKLKKTLRAALKMQRCVHWEQKKLAREIVSLYYSNKLSSYAEENFDKVFVKKSIPVLHNYNLYRYIVCVGQWRSTREKSLRIH